MAADNPPAGGDSCAAGSSKNPEGSASGRDGEAPATLECKFILRVGYY